MVVIDEVQRVPALLDGVQALIAAPGRIILHPLHPLFACELGTEFGLERALAHGTLPGIYADPDPATRAATLRSYVDAYLREEVQAEALVRDIGGYSRLLDLVAASSGRVINLHALSKDAAVSYETARRYLDVLEDTLILFRIPAWSGSDRTSVVVHPKVLLFDVGVRNALLRRPLDRALPDEQGLLLAHLIGLELRGREGTIWPEARLQHFRTRKGAEVDYVLSVGREVWGIEVKASRQVDTRDLKGLEALAHHAPRLTRRLVVYLGGRRQRFDNVDVLRLGEFLKELPR